VLILEGVKIWVSPLTLPMGATALPVMPIWSIFIAYALSGFSSCSYLVTLISDKRRWNFNDWYFDCIFNAYLPKWLATFLLVVKTRNSSTAES